MDFLARYAAGTLVAQGVSPYDTHRLLETEQRLRPGLEPLPFFDPPPTAALFRVLAGLPMSTASAVWEVLTVLGVAALGVVLARIAGATRPTALAVAVALLAVFGPVRATVWLGQIDVLFVLPFVAAAGLSLLREGSGPVAGAAAVLAVLALAKPQLALLPVAVLGLFLVRSRPLPTLAGATASVVAMLVVPAMLAPAASWGGWLKALRSQPSDTPLTLRILAALLGLVGLLFVARTHVRRPRATGSRLAYLLLLATCAGGLGAAVVRWNPQWSVALALPGAAVLAAWLRSGGTWSTRDRVALAVAIGASLPEALRGIESIGLMWLGVPKSLALGGLVMVGAVLLRALPLRLAVASWLLQAAFLLAFVPSRIKVLLLVLALLWLLPTIRSLRVERHRPGGADDAVAGGRVWVPLNVAPVEVANPQTVEVEQWQAVPTESRASTVDLGLRDER
jgi:hypothetical protein